MLVLHLNCTAVSQSESSNVFTYIIRHDKQRTHWYMLWYKSFGQNYMYVILTIFNLYTHCVVPENINTPPTKDIWFEELNPTSPSLFLLEVPVLALLFLSKSWLKRPPASQNFQMFSSRKCPYSPFIRDWNFLVGSKAGKDPGPTAQGR